jgi:hypothetical protein
MPATRLHRRIARKGASAERIAADVAKNPEWIPELIEGLASDQARIKYGCAKVLRLISEKDPRLLYPRMRFFAELLEHENNFLQWEALSIVANLTRVDSRRKFEKIFDRYFAPIRGETMITAANTIRNAATIALAKPKLTDRIVGEIVKVEKARYRTAECRRVALGHAIDTFDRVYDQIGDRTAVAGLVRRQLRSPRAATKKRAQRFVKKHGPS